MAEQNYANPAALVSTQWVVDHLNDPNVRLIEVDVDTSAYGQGHIQGAVGVNWTTQLGDPIRRDIPTKEAWGKLLSEAGVTPSTRIVFFGDNNNWFAAFAYWVAKIYGHDDVALMDGGRKKWELEKRELVKDAPSHTSASYKAKEPNWSLRAYQPQVKEYINAAGKAMVDVRSPAGGPSCWKDILWVRPLSNTPSLPGEGERGYLILGGFAPKPCEALPRAPLGLRPKPQRGARALCTPGQGPPLRVSGHLHSLHGARSSHRLDGDVSRS